MSRGASFVESLARVAHHRGKGNRWMAFLEAYIDESGTEPKWPLVTVGGVLATEGDWKALSAAWDAALEPFGLPYFHATDFEAREDIFKKLSREERARLQGSLIDIVANLPAFVHAFTLWRGPKEERAGPLADVLETPYPAAIGETIAYLAQAAPAVRIGSSADEQGVAYVCDTQKEWGGAALEQFRRMQIAEELPFRERLVSMNYANFRKCPPLQVADIVVYEIWKHFLNRATSNRPERRSFTRLKSGKLSFTVVYGGRRALEAVAWPIFFNDLVLPRVKRNLAQLRGEKIVTITPKRKKGRPKKRRN